MSLPVPFDDGRRSNARHVAKARRAEASADLDLLRYSLKAHILAEADRLDSEAARDASRAALDAEFDLLDHGLARAGGSVAKTAIAARHVERLVTINDRRITRRFGG